MNLRARTKIILSNSDIEMMSRDPRAMYLHSLQTNGRLPDSLHEAMLLFSFDPEFGQCVKDYLMWSASCEKINEAMERLRRFDRKVELVAVCSFLFATLSYLSAILFLVH